MPKRVRKGISLLASFAMGAGLMIGTFAAPAAAVADNVTIDKVGGARYDFWYDTELHGQVCDFYFNYGDNFDTTYANEGVFINGTFSGPNAAEMELVSVTLVDLPEGSDNDLLELDWVDFNRYNRAGVDSSGGINDTEDAEMEECSSDHDFEVFMEDTATSDTEIAYWDVAGDYTYRLAFANSFDGDGTVTMTRDVVITVAGDIADIDLVLNGDKTSVTWPVEDVDYFNPFNGTGDYVNASLTYLDADGNPTHPGSAGFNTDLGYDSYDGGDPQDIYQVAYFSDDWSEEIWIMSNDWDTGDYMIHEEGTNAAEYSEEHDADSGFGFNYTSAYFWLPTAEDGEDPYYSVVEEDGSRTSSPFSDVDDYYSDNWQWSDGSVGADEVALKQGLVDYKGDFTGGVELDFYVGSDVAEVSSFWVRIPYSDPSAPIDSNTVSIDFRDWVDPDSLGEDVNITAKTGVVVPGEWFDCDWWATNPSELCEGPSDLPTYGSYYYDLGIVRKDVSSFNVTYAGGTDNAGKFIAIDPIDLAVTYSASSTLTFDDYKVMLTDTSGNLTLTGSTTGESVGSGVFADIESWVDADEWDDWGHGYTSVEYIYENAGFWPSSKLQSTSTFAKVDPLSYEPELIYAWMTEWHKSVLLESTQSMTYKVTDVWGTPIAGMGAFLASDCWTGSLWCAEFAEYDDFEVTNSSGLVTYTVENIDDPADVVARHEGDDDCDNIANCQENLEDVQGDAADYYTQAEFWVIPSSTYLDGFSDSYWSSEFTRFQFVRSTTVDDLVGEVWRYDIEYTDMDDYDGTGALALQVDTEGDEKEDLYWWAVPLNADGVALAGVGSYSVSGTDGSFVNTVCDAQGLDEYTYGCWSYLELFTWDTGDGLADVSQFTETVSGSANPREIEVQVTGSLVGTTTFTMTVAGYSESFDQEYFNTVEDARYIAAVATDAANVIAGNIATATFKVTDRFGNVVEDVDVTFSENGLGEFLSNDPASTTGVTNADGVTSVDILTPANAMGTSAVTAEFETLQNEAANADFGITAAVESADATITWTHITPTIDVKALKYRAGIKVFVQNAIGNITRVYVDGKMKRVFVPATVNGFEKILLKKGGKRTVVVTIASPLGNIFETYELKIKKNKKK